MKNVFALLILLFIALTSNADINEKVRSSDVEYSHADSLYYSQNYSEALDYYIKAMKLAEKENNSEIYLACVGYIANIYSNFGDNLHCRFYLEKGYKGAVRANNNDLKSSFLINLIRIYCDLGDVEKANKYFKILKETPPDNYKDSWSYYLLYDEAKILFVEKKYKEAINAHKRALKFAKDNNMGHLNEMYQENEIANIYVFLKDYDNSLKWGKLCEERALKEKNTELLVNSYNVLYTTYANLGDKDNEKKYRHYYTSMKDSLYNIDSFFESSFKLQEYEKNRYESLYTNLFIKIAIVIVIIIIILVSVLYYKKNYRTSKKNENEALLLNDEQIEDLFIKIDKLINDMKYVFDPDFSLQMLADEIQSNTKYVSWVINKKYQHNFKYLLNKKRIEEACKMLEDDEICKSYTIQSIYEKIGYKNATSFIRAFKKIVGTTPAEYRKSKQK